MVSYSAEPHGVRVEDLLHAFQQSLSAAGQEGRQVRVDFRAHLAPLLSTLQLDTAQREELHYARPPSSSMTESGG